MEDLGRIKLFTHNDLDGVGCAVVATHAYGKDVDITYCNYGDKPDGINTLMEKFLSEHKYNDYSAILITDMSVSPEHAEVLNDLFINHEVTVRLLDHHATAEWLNKYEWANVETSRGDHLMCGTSLLFDYIWSEDKEFLESHPYLPEFVDLVESYDTWRWEKEENIMAKYLNDYLRLYGIKKFITRMLFCFNYHSKKDAITLIDNYDLEILQTLDKRLYDYIDELTKIVYITPVNIGGITYKTGVIITADQNVSVIGNVLCKKYPEADFFTIVTPNSSMISFRTIHDHINVGEIAKRLGGGGHAKASGVGINTIYEMFSNLVITLIQNKGQ